MELAGCFDERHAEFCRSRHPNNHAIHFFGILVLELEHVPPPRSEKRLPSTPALCSYIITHVFTARDPDDAATKSQGALCSGRICPHHEKDQVPDWRRPTICVQLRELLEVLCARMHGGQLNGPAPPTRLRSTGGCAVGGGFARAGGRAAGAPSGGCEADPPADS